MDTLRIPAVQVSVRPRTSVPDFDRARLVGHYIFQHSGLPHVVSPFAGIYNEVFFNFGPRQGGLSS